MTSDEIFDLISSSGYSYANALSISNSIYKKGIKEVSMIPRISGSLKSELSENFQIGIFIPCASEVSIDKSIKYLFSTEDGRKFETVYIPDNKRHTLCVSTQSGCRMGCSFCVTGRYGFHGNLTAAEIINQIISLPVADRITHIVFMGMGEPMDNIENVLKACKIITSEWGMSISPRNVTVSTVGITPGVEKFLTLCDCNLTLSLYSPFSDERRKLTPVENKYPVKRIIDILKSYPLKKKRRFSIAYLMIHDQNDKESHLEELKSILIGSKIRVNLLSFHQTGNEDCLPSTDERMQYFKHSLVVSGISASIRKSRGTDISAACGLLAENLN